MSTTSRKPTGATVVNKAESAVAGRPPVLCTEDCQPCTRLGWTFLAVTPGVVPKEFEDALTKESYQWPKAVYDTHFVNLPREGTLPVVRPLRQGYVTVIFPARQRADVWQVSPEGLTRKILHQVDAKQYAAMQSTFLTDTPAKACSRGAANVPGSLIHVEHAADVAEIWVGFTPHLLAPSVFAAFLLNETRTQPLPDGKTMEKPLRELHGRTLSPSGVLAGEFPPGVLPINEHALLTIADFVKQPSAKFKQAFELCTKPLDERRGGLAEEFTANVRYMEKANSPPKNPTQYVDRSLIVMLDDDIGVMTDHNTFRLAAVEAKQLWAIGGEGIHQKPDPARAWALRSSLHLDMVLQWEKHAAAKRITDATRDVMERRYGAMTTKEAFDARQAQGGYEPGTTFEPTFAQATPTDRKNGRVDEEGNKLDANGKKILVQVPSQQHAGGLTVLGRVRLPDAVVEKKANENGADTAEGMRDRLEGRVDMGKVKEFRKAFQEESDRWDQRIAALDKDFLAWRNCERFHNSYLHLLEHRIKLITIDASLGTLDQQTADLAARFAVVNQAVGGGALTIHTAKALAQLYKLNPADPLNWFDYSFFKIFEWREEVWKDAGNHSEQNEGVAAMRSLAQTVRESIAKQRNRFQLENTLNSIIAARAQMVNFIAASVDKKMAESLGIAAVSEGEARQAYRVHVKVSLLNEELISLEHDVRIRQKFVFNLQMPVGVALDELRDAMNQGAMPVDFKSKNQTTRQERRLTERQFAKLKGRINTEMNYPVLLNRELLDKLRAQAVKDGKQLVKIVPDAHLGLSSGPFMVPEHVANRLVREQAVTLRQALTDNNQGTILGAIFMTQVWALFDTGIKMFTEEGIEQVDGVLSTLSTALGLMETRNTTRLLIYTMQADGARTLKLELATNIAKVRLSAGLFGAAASAVDASLAFVRGQHASRAGDNKAAVGYYAATTLYALSAISSAFGSVFTYTAFAASGPVMGMGVATSALLGAWLMGAGIVLSIVAFGFMLYVLHVKYHHMDIFLDRSYWGLGKRTEGKFGEVTREQLEGILNDRNLDRHSKFVILRNLVHRGMRAEIEALNVLPIGLQIDFEWNKNLFKPDAVVFKVTTQRWPAKRNIDLRIDLYEADGAPRSQ
nr:T6SS effector BTH_I2691 family protein [uncultured Caldimonas sp.]